MEPISVKIEYWTFPDGSPTGTEPVGIEIFRSDLENAYVSFVRGRAGACGGGLYEFAIDIATSITFTEVAKFILSGIAYDLVKSGAHSFILRPLIKSFEKLKSRNQKIAISIDELRFSFQDTDIVIKKISKQPLFDVLEGIFRALAENFDVIKNNEGEIPYIVHIPIFKDPDQRFSRFRSILDVDETIQGITTDSYLQFWGVRYNLEGQIRVFDVQRHFLIDDRYLTQEEYWAEWERERIEEKVRGKT